MTMPITLNLETERLLEARLRSGGFSSVDAVVVAALNALSELEAVGLDNAALEAIDEAEEQIDCGAVHNWNDVREQVRTTFSRE